jgi:hypothetical protein
MLKYVFSIYTRNGQKVDGLLISSHDTAGAERKVKQMYQHCEILSCEFQQQKNKHLEAVTIEEILTLISK